MERLPASPGRLPQDPAMAPCVDISQRHTASATAQFTDASSSQRNDDSSSPSSSGTSMTSSQSQSAAVGAGVSRDSHRHSKDDNFVHDGTGIFLPAAFHTANSDDDVLLTAATALRCPWSDKRYTRRVSHHGDASDPLLPLADEPTRRITLTGTEHMSFDAVVLPVVASDRKSSRPPALPSAAKGRKQQLPMPMMMMMMPEGASACYITIE